MPFSCLLTTFLFNKSYHKGYVKPCVNLATIKADDKEVYVCTRLST